MNAADIENDIFLIKHNYIVHTLEDELVLELSDAISEGRYVEIFNFGREGKESPPARKVIPMQILSSLQTGRRYVAAWDISMNRFISSRLDFIREVRVCEVCEAWDETYKNYHKCTERSFGVSFAPQSPDKEPEPLRIVFRLDEEKEYYILKRLERERRCGRLERLGTGLYSVTFDIDDPQEVMHWAKSFIGRIASLEGGTDDVRNVFFSDIRRMAEMYGGISDDDIQ